MPAGCTCYYSASTAANSACTRSYAHAAAVPRISIPNLHRMSLLADPERSCSSESRGFGLFQIQSLGPLLCSPISLSLLLYVCVGGRTRPGRTRRMLREERRKTLKHHVTVDGFGPQIIVGLHACPALHLSGRDTVRGHERNRRRVVRTFLLGSHSVFPGAGCDKLIQRIV
jgi:hypothetical protein